MARSKVDQKATAPEETPVQTNSEKSSQESTTWSDIKHFAPREFTCKCNGLCDHSVAISIATVAKLDKIRDLIGLPVTILSGTRCARHNNKVGGKTQSGHLVKNGESHAADVLCSDSGFRFAFLAAALPVFNRIGIGKDFIHVDDDPELPENTVWVYGA